MSSLTKTKKVFLLIVEGPSDKTTFENAILQFFQVNNKNSSVKCDIIHGDIACEDKNKKPITETIALKTVGNEIKGFLQTNHLQPKDLIAVAQICDLDACFADEKSYKESQDIKTRYDPSTQTINRKNITALFTIRDQKRRNLLRLSSKGCFNISKSSIPYRLFYLGIDLEYAFYKKLSCTDEEKRSLSSDFDSKVYKNKNFFIDTIKNINSIGNDYFSSWNPILLGQNSFNQITNLQYLLDWIKSIII